VSFDWLKSEAVPHKSNVHTHAHAHNIKPHLGFQSHSLPAVVKRWFMNASRGDETELLKVKMHLEILYFTIHINILIQENPDENIWTLTWGFLKKCEFPSIQNPEWSWTTKRPHRVFITKQHLVHLQRDPHVWPVVQRSHGDPRGEQWSSKGTKGPTFQPETEKRRQHGVIPLARVADGGRTFFLKPPPLQPRACLSQDTDWTVTMPIKTPAVRKPRAAARPTAEDPGLSGSEEEDGVKVSGSVGGAEVTPRWPFELCCDRLSNFSSRSMCLIMKHLFNQVSPIEMKICFSRATMDKT